jgi:P4 family phage/plasmid primase-like protien
MIAYSTTCKTTTGQHRTITAEKFIERLNNCEPTYEKLPEDTNSIVNLYADIDSKQTYTPERLQEITDSFKDLLNDTFGPLTYTVLTSHGIDKSSWHIHSNDINGRVCDWKQYMTQINELIKTEFKALDLPLFDTSVYSSNRYMRCYGTSKDGENRPFILLEGTLENSIIIHVKPDARTIEPIEQELQPTMKQTPDGIQYTDDVKLNMMQLFISHRLLETCASGTYDEWIKIAFAIYNTFGNGEQGFKLFCAYSKLSTKHKPTDYDLAQKWAEMRCTQKNKMVSFGSICHFAKLNNPEQFKIIQNKTRPIINDKDEQLLISGTEVDLSIYIDNKWGKKITYCDKQIYVNKNNLWVEDENNFELNKIIEETKKCVENCIFNNMRKKEEVNNKDELEKINKIIDKLTKTKEKIGSVRTRDNIIRQIGRIRTDKNFVKSLNREINILPLQGGKQIDITTLEITNRTENSKFTYECGANFIRNMTPELEQEIDTYFNQMFVIKETKEPDIDTKQCFIDIIKSCCVGIPFRNIYFLIGEGKNGKSLLLKILKNIFNAAADTISKDVIIKSKHNSQLTTHLEKLDKIRFGFTSELEITDELNQTIIKQITGGDSIDCRSLQRTNRTLTPTTNLFAITNDLAKFTPDKATEDRLMIIPFNQTFENNKKFEAHMTSQPMLDAIFTYILTHGTICDNFKESDAMFNAKDDYIEQNNKSHLTDFIDTMCEVSEDLKIERNIFKQAYDNWLGTRGLKADRRDYNNFSRAMKKLGYPIKPSNNVCYYAGINIIPTCKVEFVPANPYN